MQIDQIAIAASGVVAAWINQDPRGDVRRWAGAIGMLGQPFYIYATWHAGQWGMLLVTLGWTVAFARGICLGWVKRWRRG